MVTEVWSIINGTRINHTQGSGNQWVGTGTAPLKSSYSQPNHVYQVTTYAKDDAGNTDSYESTLRVVEKVAPTITPSSPTTGSTITNNKPSIVWEVKDDDSGVNTASIGITIDSGSKITGDAIQKQAITGGYKCTYTPSEALSDGNYTIKFDAADNDGNVAAQKSITIKIDTVPPSLTLDSPEEGLVTNNPNVTVSGVTNDVTSSPVTLTVNDQPTEVQSDGHFNTVYVLTEEGKSDIVVKATDSAGKTTTITRHVTLDTGAPVIESAVINPDPADSGEAITITAIVTDA